MRYLFSVVLCYEMMRKRYTWLRHISLSATLGRNVTSPSTYGNPVMGEVMCGKPNQVSISWRS